ncbi:NAD(P)-dependent dehydrogenase (short-subunit alcohol dehydrogenase family) [Allocatelliglobosispora scoriae]|uniref:NAD(P)-dependent dehydrogenase (Short-subunit alcohol dehydrogenase family) n=1 Tax=Allocatelliglobosispora scoriae TaxID=643052 RepID=A0A841BH15_9ACTN|nr:SDR family oxidoreductase [Allocatelliglobosispora scoriae]MBB5866925.1 NAD(P)-dependent dehydrogenase (short-subunit alcohol dehydrogenase family) [Allocatelliglobosispora scoriae]
MTIAHLSRLDGARALITGASRGIGRKVAETLADAGADVVVSARTLGALDDVVRAVEERGRKAVAVAGDLAEPGTGAAVVDQAAAALGGLDIIVHSAGIVPQSDDGTTVLLPFQDFPPDQWARVIDVNLNATAAVCRAAHPHLLGSDRASLLLVSSCAGVMGTPLLDAYAVTKAAQLSLTRSLAVSWAGQGIRVNALCPGWTRTEMTAFAADQAPVSEWLISHVPMGRWADPKEIAAVALFLCSPAASFVTGHALLVDGGLSIADGGLAGTPKPPSPFAPA